MERRNFLKGLFAAGGASILAYPKRKIDEATALVQMATPEEMDQLRKADKFGVIKGRTPTESLDLLYKAMLTDGEVYVKITEDEFMSVGTIAHMAPISPVDGRVMVDVTTVGSDFQSYRSYATQKRRLTFTLIP